MTTLSHNNSNTLPPKKAVLSIAGFDPTGGAGILIDSAVFRMLGLHPLSVLTSIAAQGGTGIKQVVSLPDQFIRDELAIITAEFDLAAIKIGMIHNIEAVRVVSEYLNEQDVPTVLDPVITASSGGKLIEEEALAELETLLIPKCSIITPNIPEATYFLGQHISTVAELETAALKLSTRWGCAVLLKGGHLDKFPVDILAKEGESIHFAHTLISTTAQIRGTGCILSSAVAGFLTRDYSLEKTVETAIDYTITLIQNSYTSGKITDVCFPDLFSTQ